MNPVTLLLLLINLVVLALLGLRVMRLRREIDALAARSSEVAGGPEPPEELRRIAREGTPMLSIRILNPMELAAQKHWLAGIAGRVTPGIVRRLVAFEAAKMVRLELPKWGVQAEVEVIGRD